MKITTEAEYESALARINEIFNCKPGTSECDEMTALVEEIVAYEEIHYPILPPSILGAVQYYIESKGLMWFLRHGYRAVRSICAN